MTALKNDRALRFYNEVLGLERLHYGYWQGSEDLNLENLKVAQIRYEQLLIDQIPKGSVTVLDVGCGTGVMSKSLKAQGFQVEGLSPDINQKKPYEEKVGNTFHQTCFEDFQPEKKYDVVMMSESCQYIPLDRIFLKLNEALSESGTWIICDYFVNDNAKGKLSKSGHNLNTFLTQAKENGFEIVKQEDVTDNMTPTLDLGKQFVERCLIAADLGLEKARSKHPIVLKLLSAVFGKRIKKAKTEMKLLDAEEFKKNKSYQLLVLNRSV